MMSDPAAIRHWEKVRLGCAIEKKFLNEKCPLKKRFTAIEFLLKIKKLPASKNHLLNRMTLGFNPSPRDYRHLEHAAYYGRSK